MACAASDDSGRSRSITSTTAPGWASFLTAYQNCNGLGTWCRRLFEMTALARSGRTVSWNRSHRSAMRSTRPATQITSRPMAIMGGEPSTPVIRHSESLRASRIGMSAGPQPRSSTCPALNSGSSTRSTALLHRHRVPRPHQALCQHPRVQSAPARMLLLRDPREVPVLEPLRLLTAGNSVVCHLQPHAGADAQAVPRFEPGPIQAGKREVLPAGPRGDPMALGLQGLDDLQ